MRWIVGLATLVLVPLGVVGVHDAWCHYVDFDIGTICERADGSLWRHACSWVFLQNEIGPNGPPPSFDGPEHGHGVLGRS